MFPKPVREDTMDSASFAEVLRKFPLAVSVVTVGRGGAENALTVSWATPASFEPPMFLVAVDRLHYSVDFVKSTRNFTVNVLAEGQEKLAGQFARQSMQGEDKLAGVAHREGQTGAPILTDAVAYFDCELAFYVEAGDHYLLVGRVVDAAVLRDARALVGGSALRYQKSGS
ncbi:MAG: flavin reductase domain protein FMN-binding [Anaeromyxobacteraceae bacterium]|jgi:flavin reductase (DIM6/NTAB) family NADH-FMN oxidoreductase RutF|nr:flavin reductase domain protein FMN-binding [Anaeromyxobacteraceae bacterium]